MIPYHNTAYAVDFCPASRLGGTFFFKVLAGESPTNPLCSITIKAKKTGSLLRKNLKRAKKVKKFIPYTYIELFTSHTSKMGCIDFNNGNRR